MSSESAQQNRLPFLDALRGFVVLVMLLWHTADSWLLRDQRRGIIWEILEILSGVGAPCFVLLAGAALAFKVAADEQRGIPSRETIAGLVTRGLEIVVLGYALRLQTWLIDSSGLMQPGAWRIVVPGICGLTLLLIGLRGSAGRSVGVRLAELASGIALYALAFQQLGLLYPREIARALRPDILHSIGASMVLVSLVGRVTPALKRPEIAALFGIAIALATPLVMPLVPGVLPEALAGYIAKWSPGEGVGVPPRFPLFPWAGYVFWGVGVGLVYRRALQNRRLAHTVVVGTVLGAVVALLFGQDFLLGSPWVQSVTNLGQSIRFVHRIGFVLVMAGIAYALTPRVAGFWSPLQTFGRTSLLVYWVHLEFAYGVSVTALKRSLTTPQWALGVSLLSLLMYALARLRLGPMRRMWSSARFRKVGLLRAS